MSSKYERMTDLYFQTLNEMLEPENSPARNWASFREPQALTLPMRLYPTSVGIRIHCSLLGYL